jgi:ribonuclease HII
MPWIVGIDEAGYGPNLGPLVMSSVACFVPEKLVGVSLWKVLRTAVRRHTANTDNRLLVDDSKLVYSTTRGLHALETGVAATLNGWPKSEAITLDRLLSYVAPSHRADPKFEHWYTGSTLLPVELNGAELSAAASRFGQACQKKEITWGSVRCAVVHASRFNLLLDEWQTKGAVLGETLRELVRANLECLGGREPIWFVVDKHGGRNTYAALLQATISEGFVAAETEGMDQSRYHVIGLGREVRFTFQPRADSRQFCVAMASMISKYLREIFMLEFNRYWQEQIPGLEPTAGYPGDAARFYAAMRPALEELGIAKDAVWRRR